MVTIIPKYLFINSQYLEPPIINSLWRIYTIKDIYSVLRQINNILADTAKSRTGKIPEENKPQYTKLDRETVRQLVKSEYSEAYNRYIHDCYIFRGVSNREKNLIKNFKILKPGLRVTAGGVKRNLYTRLLSDILPSWKDFPPRNRSFICSTSSGYALNYTGKEPKFDNVYVVLPKNGAKIGICSTADIWTSFKILNEHDLSLDGFQNAFLYIIELIGRELDEIITNETKKKTTKYSRIGNILDNATKYKSDQSIIIILNTLSEKLKIYIDEIIERLEKKHTTAADMATSMLREMKKLNAINIIEFLDIILNPKANGFKVVNIKNFREKAIVTYRPSNDGKEVWTDSECLFITLKDLATLFVDYY